jgi:hypothetical protein
MKAIREFEDANQVKERTKIIIVSAQEFEPFFYTFDGIITKPIKVVDIINTLHAIKQQ